MSNTSEKPQSAYSQEMHDAWWLSRHGELIRKAARNQPARPELIPRPLAAYRLGLLSRCIWIRNKGVWETPGDQSAWSGVSQATKRVQPPCRL